MKLSKQRQTAVYEAIHKPLVDMRIHLKLPAEQDAVLATLEHYIWRCLLSALEVAGNE